MRPLTAALGLTLLISPPALAQTPLGGPPPIPQDQPAAPPIQAGPSIPPPPVTQQQVDQTRAHFQGRYTSMNRRNLQGGEIQEAWDDAAPQAGVWLFEYCRNCTYRGRLREFMATSIQLPEGEVIETIDVGDQDNFPVKARTDNSFTIRPMGFGGDTSLIVYGQGGRVYPFYLRSEGVYSDNIPDLLIRITGVIDDDEEKYEPSISEPEADQDKPNEDASKDNEDSASGLPAQAISDLNPGGYIAPKPGDFVEHVPFDPDALHGWGDYELSGDEELKPETVFRDNRFTYIRFGKRFESLELPTAYLVRDEIDELVNPHLKGTTLVVEAIGRMITLKSGAKYLCIEYEGES